MVGANPLEGAALASRSAFVVVQDMFLTETAQRADVVFPAASAYEKDGTVTNVTGEVQRLKRALKTMGAKPDLEIIGLHRQGNGRRDASALATPDVVFEEIRKNVRGYDVPLPVLATGGAAQTHAGERARAGRHRPDLVQSARDTLFTSGTLGRYSKA